MIQRGYIVYSSFAATFAATAHWCNRESERPLVSIACFTWWLQWTLRRRSRMFSASCCKMSQLRQLLELRHKNTWLYNAAMFKYDPGGPTHDDVTSAPDLSCDTLNISCDAVAFRNSGHMRGCVHASLSLPVGTRSWSRGIRVVRV